MPYAAIVNVLQAEARLQPLLTRFPWLLPAIFLGGGLVLGFVIDRIVMGFLRRLAAKTRWEADDVIINSLRNMGLLWFFLAGAWGAVNATEFPVRWEDLLRKSLQVLFIFSLTVVAARIASGLVTVYSGKSEGLLPSTSIFRNLTATVVFLVGALVVLDTLGISITPILTALGVGGLAVALALQDTLSNLFAGIQIIASRQVRIGDYIRLESGEEGYVTDIRWRNTTVRALPNNMILIPNSKLASTITTNYYMPEKEMAVLVQVGVAYDSDLQKVERVTIDVGKEVMREVQGGIPEFEPFIRYHTFSDSSINFSVILRGKEFVDQYLIKHEFVKRLQHRYQQEGIEIPFPIRTLYMKGKTGGADA
jgi:small-conductance mechanosensitive channel